MNNPFHCFEEEEKGMYLCNMCMYCEGEMVVEKGIYVCTLCGCEGGNVMSLEEEWGGSKEKSSRCGFSVNPLLPQASKGIKTSGYNRDMRSIETRNFMNATEKAIFLAQEKMVQMGKELEIHSELVDKAIYLYSEITKNEKLKRADVRKGLMASCLYKFCNEEKGMYISDEKFCKVANIRKKKFHDGMKIFNDLIHKKKYTKDCDQSILRDIKKYTTPINSVNIAESLSKRCGFYEEDIANIVYITKRMEKLNPQEIANRSCASKASGCILLYLQYKKKPFSIKKLVSLSDVSESTIKATTRDLDKYKMILIAKTKEQLQKENCYPTKTLEEIYTIENRY